MFPREKLKHIPEDKLKELEEITEAIKSSGLTEIVILFGSYARGNFSLKEGRWSGGISDFDLFVITSGKNQKSLEIEIKDLLPETETYVEIISEDIKTFEVMIKENRFFYVDVKREGIILYDTEKYKLPNPSKKMNPQLRLKIAKENFEEKFIFIKYVYDDAITNINKERYRLSAFHLQQVFEKSYKLIDLIFTQYEKQGHKLIPLRIKAKKLDNRIDKVFKIKTESEKDSFEHLCKAYIGARYHLPESKLQLKLDRPTYDVTKEEVEFWKDEAKKLIEITKIICKEKISSLEK